MIFHLIFTPKNKMLYRGKNAVLKFNKFEENEEFERIAEIYSHLIFKELNKFDCRVSVNPNGLEKYMSFTLNRNIVFINSMLFLNSSLYRLVKNLSDKDFKYLSDVFSDEELELVKQKGVYPYEYFNSFGRFKETKLPDIDCFFSSLKN